MGKIAPRQRHPRGPRALGLRKERLQLFKSRFRQTPIGGDLAAKHVQQGRAVGVQRQHIIACRRRGRFRPIIVERPHPGIGPDHILDCHRSGEILACKVQQIIALFIGADSVFGRALMILVGGADQGEILLIGHGKDDPPIGALEEIAAIVVIKLARHDVAAAHQPHPFGRIDPRHVADHVFDPRPAGIDQGAGAIVVPPLWPLGFDLPQTVQPIGRNDARARHDLRAPLGRIAGVQRDELAVLDPAIRIFIGMAEPRLQRRPRRIARQIECPRCGQNLPPAQRVIQEQPQPDQPRRPPPLHPRHHPRHQSPGGRVALKPHVGVIGQHKAHRP